jgi:hypothetical protein
MLNDAIKALKLRVKPRKAKGARKVICIGLQKTGTTTFQKCMEALGFDHKGNSPEIYARWRRGNRAALFDIIEKYDSFDDVPYFVLYKDIFEKYGSSALYVLTLRSSPEVWLESMKAHALGSRPWTSNFENIYGYPYPHGREQDFIDFYSAHQEGVRRFFRERGALGSLRELCWENGDSWGELCDFVGKPKPSIPFPHARRRPARDPDREVDNMIRANHQMLDALSTKLSGKS